MAIFYYNKKLNNHSSLYLQRINSNRFLFQQSFIKGVMSFIKYCIVLINKQQNITMIKNSTKKFKERYTYSSVKILQTVEVEKQAPTSSLRSVKFNTTLNLNYTKSTPKLQNPKKQLSKTQPLIIHKKQTVKEDKYSVFTDQASIETIYTVMKKKGIEDSQFSQHKSGKIKRLNRNSLKVRDPEQFIENMPKNSLFFCCQCFQYIFDIEKNRHFPDCKDQLSKSQKNITRIGIQKLRKVVDLANYTETKVKQINQLYDQFENGTHQKLAQLEYPRYNFFTLNQIKYAFAYIFDQLLKNAKYENDTTFFTCF